MTAWETTLKTLNAEGIGGPLTYRHSRTSSVTTSWGVDWDDEFSHFFHDRNPLLGPKLWASWNEQFAIYRATTPDGHVFYRRLRRGRIPDLPVVLVIEKQFERIEKKTRRDRDRNAFGEELMNLFYAVFARSGLRDSHAGQRVVVEAARPCWPRGHPLLSAIAEAQRWHPWPADLARKVFGDGFYARATASDPALSLEFQALEKSWQDQNRKPLPAYFRQFGVLNAADHSEEFKRKALEEQKQRHQRPPTGADHQSLRVLSEIIRVLSPEILATLRRKRVEYSVAETEVLLGELKQHRPYGSEQVFLSAQVFVTDFGEAVAVFLQEHAHVFGYDGSRGFTDALTRLIENAVRYRKDLDRYEARWVEAREAVLHERAQRADADPKETVADRVGALNEAQLRDLLQRLPVVAVWRALEEQTT